MWGSVQWPPQGLEEGLKIQSFLKLWNLSCVLIGVTWVILIFSLMCDSLLFQILIAVCIHGFTYWQISMCLSPFLLCLCNPIPCSLINLAFAVVPDVTVTSCRNISRTLHLWEWSLVRCQQSLSCDSKHVCFPSLASRQNESWKFLSYEGNDFLVLLKQSAWGTLLSILKKQAMLLFPLDVILCEKRRAFPWECLNISHAGL